MPRKSINLKVVGPIVLIVAVFLAISFYNVSKNKQLLENNNDLISNAEILNSKILLLSEQLESSISRVQKQLSELDRLRNKLTQERLQNVKLQQDLDELKSKMFIDSSEEKPAEEAQGPS